MSCCVVLTASRVEREGTPPLIVQYNSRLSFLVKIRNWLARRAVSRASLETGWLAQRVQFLTLSTLLYGKVPVAIHRFGLPKHGEDRALMNLGKGIRMNEGHFAPLWQSRRLRPHKPLALRPHKPHK